MTNFPSLRQRRCETRTALTADSFDLLVVGGGITGAGIARDAQMRGVKVALVDKGDFASGTSSRSSKLVHGGLRYLEHGEVKLVLEACRERDLLRRHLAPHLVHPLPFLFPIYRGDPVGRIRLSAAMWIYDALSIFRNVGLHRYVSSTRVTRTEPLLRDSDLVGAMFYYDCWTDDARLTLENVLSAHGLGAVVCNHMGVTGFKLGEDGRVEAVELEDELAGDRISVRARVVVNATGPWVDKIRTLEDPDCAPVLRPTKGVHILVPRERIGNRYAVVTRGLRDKRVMFVIPWEEQTLLGTTDTDFRGNPDIVSTEDDDVRYLLETANHYFPHALLTERDIIGGYAGVRPLVAPEADRSASPSSVSREEVILRGRSGLISVAGGKLTTYRSMAESVTDCVVRELGKREPKRRFAGCHTAVRPLPGAEKSEVGDGTNGAAAKQLPLELRNYVAGRYGARSGELTALLADPQQRCLIMDELPYLRAEIEYAAVAEFAATLEDVFRRRTQIAFRALDAGLGKAATVVDILGAVHGWSPEEKAAELRRYRESVELEQAFRF